MNKSDGVMDTKQHEWTLIEGAAAKKGLVETEIVRLIEREMGIKISKVDKVEESYYHAQLTDDNVNEIDRSEGKLLDFFAVKELDNLALSESTSQFISKHSALI
jgi:hypothetical protein